MEKGDPKQQAHQPNHVIRAIMRAHRLNFLVCDATEEKGRLK
jgi:hypothetical protein